MKQHEITQKNIELSAEFSRYLFDHPDANHAIPSDAELILLPDDDPSLKRHNQNMGNALLQLGEKVVFVRIGKMLPRKHSRIIDADINACV